MKNKKNIDRLFQERFKDFETEPNDQTWLNIQTALQEEKKERRIVPIWFKYAGIAVVLFPALFALNTNLKKTNLPINIIVLEQETTTIPNSNVDSNTTKNTEGINKNYQRKTNQIVITNDKISKSNRTNTDQLSTKTKSKNNSTEAKYQNSTAVYQKEYSRPLKENKLVRDKLNTDEALVERNNTKNLIIEESVLNKNNTTILLKDKQGSKVVQTNAEKLESPISTVPNELEELLKEKEDKKELKVATIHKKKWKLVPNVAAMYLNTNSSGSAIDPQLSQNNKTAGSGFSYGVGINYALSNKFALRSGINSFSVGYNTNDVSYAAGLNSNSLANLKYTANNAIEIQNQDNLNSLISFEKNLQKTSSGSINQKMGYYEVPLEISYAILDKKIGINIIGGVSTLFLKENEIALVSPEANFKLGEATNLNSIHFSTNFGMGFKYQFAKSFQLNFEPILKYQLNTYSNKTGNFKPIIIGLYSGIIYHF
ncbi:hypothetical protein [Flavobacterium frigoris]|uniref:Outer membrane protein beta-barrel domain-containing protein n=1 Tax=Flavobacterium frigoris TaxID=229204 RepID=A0A1H9HFD7_FLAFI|nr:hypothetical protein [Flavobacterium frigoris]SEQ61040.1 hypothetical protein SAMN05444355_103122 [Flavobacterium frigoris]